MYTIWCSCVSDINGGRRVGEMLKSVVADVKCEKLGMGTKSRVKHNFQLRIPVIFHVTL